MQLPPQCRKDAAGLFSKISKSGVRFFLRKDKPLAEKRMGQIWSKGKMTPHKINADLREAAVINPYGMPP